VTDNLSGAGSCTIENVWWAAVCEDALTFKGDGDATVTGGGATGAEDKVIQHKLVLLLPTLLNTFFLLFLRHSTNISPSGAGTITIDGFTVDTFSKLYRSCGNCKESAERHVVVKNVKASNGKLLVGINPNFGDTATIDATTCASSVKEICEEFEGKDSDVRTACETYTDNNILGTTPGNEPKSVSTGPSTACGFTDPVPAC
jgi:hypothetical protein